MARAFRIILDGAQEVPSVTTTASGLGAAIFDDTTNSLQYAMVISGLDFGPIFGGASETATTTDNVVAAHIHTAARGSNGGVAFNLLSQDADDFAQVENPDDTRTLSGNWEATDPAPITPYVTQLSTATVGSDVDFYINIHTSGNPGGELRGQLVTIADDLANTVAGTTGNDILPGLAGNDSIDGGVGNDFIEGGAGSDSMDGGADTDTLLYQGSNAGVNVDLGTGTVSGGHAEGDTFSGFENLVGSEFADMLTGDTNANSLNGGGGNDILTGGIGNDTLDGGEGFDFADFSAFGTGTFVIDLETPGNSSAQFAADTLLNIRGLFGSGTASNLFTGDGDRTFFIGGSNDDSLTGNGGGDILRGRGGNDEIDGGDDRDALLGNAGNDTLTGGADRDVFWFGFAPDGDDLITDFTVGADLIGFQGTTVNAFGDLTISTDAGTGDALITSATGTILLQGVSEAQADQIANFLFV